MSIRKEGNRWVADFTLNGRRKQLKRRTKTEALQAMELAIKAQVQLVEAQGSGFTLKEARLQSMAVRWSGTAGERNAADNSKQACEFFGENTPLDSITTLKVEQWRKHLLRQGNAPATVNRKVSALSAMFNDALLYEQIESAAKMPVRLPMNNTKDRVFSLDEEKAFRQCFELNGYPEYSDLILFLIELGCRFSEAKRAITNHVDTAHKTISFLKTKNARPRTNPCTTELWKVLERRLQPHAYGHLFPDLKYGPFKHQFDRVKAQLGLAADDQLTPHCTRHTCASRMIRHENLSTVMHWGGWMTLASVQRYLHLNVSSLASAREALENERAILSEHESRDQGHLRTESLGSQGQLWIP